MAYETKNVLSLDSKDAMDFFLKSEQYHGFELPEYFVFDELLQNVKRIVEDTPYEECLQNGISPENLSNVNLDILLNKDGHYAVRPIVLANPFLYYFLAPKFKYLLYSQHKTNTGLILSLTVTCNPFP